MTIQGNVAELFLSLQGEGPAVGEPQLFLRLAGCDIGCSWCDTKESWQVPSHFPAPLTGRHANPVSAPALAKIVLDNTPARGMVVSLTGGEPLLQAPFVTALLPLLRRDGAKVQLETAGVHSRVLADILPLVDHISMDWKVPGTTKTDLRPQHRDFLDRLGEWGGDLAVKVVLGASTPREAVEEAAREVAARSPGATLVLQPLTCDGAGDFDREVLSQAISWSWDLLSIHPRLRVLPQIHPILGIE